MNRIPYNKLVRDRIPEIIEAEGRACAVETMSPEEYRQALLTKLIEETHEAAEAPAEELIKELADLYEVIDALLLLEGIDKQVVLEKQGERHERRGGFVLRLKLLWAESVE